MWNIILFVSLIIVAAMSIASNAIEIGEKLGSVHIAVEITFYVLIAIVVLGGIVYPLVGVFFAPIFSLEKLHDALQFILGVIVYFYSSFVFVSPVDGNLCPQDFLHSVLIFPEEYGEIRFRFFLSGRLLFSRLFYKLFRFPYA